ncbi:MAG: hypothetical protein JO060_08950 [Candidatus Eremiobacteraeota bacterium]|nr:hypothetical protein [Candidatus Eremiobacteraeota bacterium]MBV9646649.1 hypothetical protein [Candidatus Eremiobacteraeota bacterium]
MPAALEEILAVTLLPEWRARRLLAHRRLRYRMLTPPYPSAGVGILRALRVREDDEGAEVVVGYDRYERLADVGR